MRANREDGHTEQMFNAEFDPIRVHDLTTDSTLNR